MRHNDNTPKPRVDDALDVPRAHAFATDRTLDAAARDVVSGDLSIDQLTLDGNA